MASDYLTETTKPETALTRLEDAVSKGLFAKTAQRITVPLTAPVYSTVKTKADELGTTVEDILSFLVHDAFGLL